MNRLPFLTPLLCSTLAGLVSVLPTPAQSPSEASAAARPAPHEVLSWRFAGPERGGRSAAVAGIPSDRDTYYFGAAGGGVWKTIDGGVNWSNVSDGFFGGSIGAVAVAPSDPNVVYVGGGEKTVRGNVSHGDGAWRSTDAGKTWTAIGLGDSRHISRIRVHPDDPDVAYAAVMGHLFGPNEQRGVFRTVDGGASWERVLFVDRDTGCVDLAVDPSNPRVMFASFWRVLRTPYSLESGGEGSGLWKTTDGGDTWTEITGNDGLPGGVWGISGVSVSPADPDVVYAIIENEDGGVFRSADGGASWRRVNSDRSLRQRAWYYTRLVADPADADGVYVLNVGFHHSKDGGRTFRRISTPHGDNHDLWVDPGDPQRMIQSNDGGANVSYDGGRTWSRQDNQPTGQFYRVSTDDSFPYKILGAQQDNSAIRMESTGAGRSVRGFESTAGGESGHIVAQPGNPDLVFGGSYGGYLTWRDHGTDQGRNVHIWPDNPMGWGAADLKYRFQWNFPIFFSPHDPNRIYAAAQVLFTSTDLGQSWTEISPDLTRDDKSKQGPSGGPITKDNTSVEYYCTIFAACESPLQAGVLWAGSDDGLVHVSRDAGGNWTNVTPPQMPQWAQINSIEPHPFEPGGLYVAATRYKLDDFAPYLFATTDFGQTWRRIDSGIDGEHFTRVVRADPECRGLLFAGTERGVYVSYDDGVAWESLQLDLPTVPVTDLAVKEDDLIAATQGRGFWILGDRHLLRAHEQLAAARKAQRPLLVAPEPTWRTGRRSSMSAYLYLPEALFGDDDRKPGAPVSVTVREDGGDVVQTWSTAPDRDAGEERLRVEPGLNRWAWDLRYPGASSFDGMILWGGGTSGPVAVPGTYRIELAYGPGEGAVEGEGDERGHLAVPATLLADPRSRATQQDYEAQFATLVRIRDLLTEVHDTIAHIREVTGQAKELKERLGRAAGQQKAAEALVRRIDAAVKELGAVENALYQTRNRSRQDPLNFPIRLNNRLAALGSAVSSGDGPPTAGSLQVLAMLEEKIEAELERYRKVATAELPAIDRAARDLDLPVLDLSGTVTGNGEGGEVGGGN